VAASPLRGAWIRLFRVAGVGVYVDPVLIVVLAALVVFGEDRPGAVSRFVLVGVLLGSVLLHELGHALVAHRRGLRVSGVYLHLLPFAYVERGQPHDELAVALAGPATSLAVAAALWIPLGAGAGLPTTVDGWFADPVPLACGVNLLMGVVNLVPALPLDGGRALRAGLQAANAAHAKALAAAVGAAIGVTTFALAFTLLEAPERYVLAALGSWLCLVAYREAR
jgi:Zn-dependent protease